MLDYMCPINVMQPCCESDSVIMLSASLCREASITAGGRRTRLGAARGLRQSTRWHSAQRQCGQRCCARRRAMAQCTCTVWRSMRGALLQRLYRKCL